MNENYVPAPVAKMHEAIQSGFDYVRNLTGRQIAAVSLAGTMALSACGAGTEVTAGEPVSKKSSTETTETTGAEQCADTWVIVEANAGEHNRYFADGIQEIKDAETPEQARGALDAWFAVVKPDAELLAGASLGILGVEVNAADLKDADGVCATPRAQEIVNGLEAALAASDVAAGEVPEDVINSGTDGNGNVVVADVVGIAGDRKGLEVTLPNGEKVYVLGRCGNLAFQNGKQPALIPKGPTDNPLFPPQGPRPKYDDGVLPGDGTPASQDHGTPDNPGVGPAGQTPDEDGYLPTETRPSVPATTTPSTTPPSTNLPPATVGPQPTSTQPPAPATTTVATTAPQNSTIPAKP